MSREASGKSFLVEGRRSKLEDEGQDSALANDCRDCFGERRSRSPMKCFSRRSQAI